MDTYGPLEAREGSNSNEVVGPLLRSDPPKFVLKVLWDEKQSCPGRLDAELSDRQLTQRGPAPTNVEPEHPCTLAR